MRNSMQRFHYKNQEYDGLVIFPFDPNAKDNTMQLNEFAEIIGEGLLTKEKWKPIPTESNRNKIVPNEDGTSIMEIPTLNGLKKLLAIAQPISYLTVKRTCELNFKSQEIFNEESYSGDYYLKEPGIIENLLYRVENSIVFGKNRLPTIITKAASLWYTIARYQAFSNGNKRTALLATVDFLQNNFLIFNLGPKTDLEKQLYNVSLKIANDEYSEENVKLFIKDHVIVDFDMLNYLITYVPQFKIIDS